MSLVRAKLIRYLEWCGDAKYKKPVLNLIKQSVLGEKAESSKFAMNKRYKFSMRIGQIWSKKKM